MEQNIFDNDEFFKGYSELRRRKANFNNLLEQPAMESLLPDMQGRTVLDLGCGFGHNCKEFIRRGAKSVVGIDISEKMLSVARRKKHHRDIEYYNMSMTDILSLDRTFDIIYSSLAFHYIADFDSFTRTLYSCLSSGGILLFSQEHPLNTATIDGKHHYNQDENGDFISYTFGDYGKPGLRSTFWYVDGVQKYHRRFTDIVNALANAGFFVTEVQEPLPSSRAAKIRPDILEKQLISPTFLIVKARKM